MPLTLTVWGWKILIIDDLITDRTAADAARVRALKSIGWENMTAAQKDEWETALKGAYGASDLNRVGQAVSYLKSYLNAMQGALDAYRAVYGVASDDIFDVTWEPITVTAKTDWSETPPVLPTPQQLADYLAAVDAVTSAITVTRDLPASVAHGLTTAGANEIEKALQAEYTAGLDFEALKKQLIENTAAAWFYSGDLYGGEI